VVECPGQHLPPNRETGSTEAEEKPTVKIPLSVIRINDIALRVLPETLYSIHRSSLVAQSAPSWRDS